jgi:drug/metabolite transporter (DMT)-like permease
MFINLMPVSALAFAVVFLGEVLRIEHAIGFTLLLTGTWLCVSRRRLAVATVS